VTGRHRGGRFLRRRLVVAVLAAALGRGYVGRHRLAQAALGHAPDGRSSEIHLLPAHRPDLPVLVDLRETAAPGGPALTLPGRASVAPWLRIVPTPAQPDQLADTLPHPVVTLLPLMPTTSPVAARTAADSSAETQVFALVDAERERAVTAELAAGTAVRPYWARHTA
jgi:hypothetical protein